MSFVYQPMLSPTKSIIAHINYHGVIFKSIDFQIIPSQQKYLLITFNQSPIYQTKTSIVLILQAILFRLFLVLLPYSALFSVISVIAPGGKVFFCSASLTPSFNSPIWVGMRCHKLLEVVFKRMPICRMATSLS